jgi:hypothetical protein
MSRSGDRDDGRFGIAGSVAGQQKTVAENNG